VFVDVLMNARQNRMGVLQDIKVPGDQVDVNVHPTKHEVVFLHQEEIIFNIGAAVEIALQGPVRCGGAALLWQGPLIKALQWPCLRNAAVGRLYIYCCELGLDRCKCSANIAHVSRMPTPLTVTEGSKSNIRPSDMVRTDKHAQKLQSFFGACLGQQSNREVAANLMFSRKRQAAGISGPANIAAVDAAGCSDWQDMREDKAHSSCASTAAIAAKLLEDIEASKHEGE
jgi:hypothetical protein